MIHYVGGYGSLATLELHKRIINKAKQNKATEDNQYPLFTIHNIPYGKTNEYSINFTEQFQNHIKRIPENEKIVVVCNTYYTTKNIPQNIVNIPQKILMQLNDQPVVFQSSQSNKHNLYQQHKPTITHPYQHIVDKAIRSVMNHETEHKLTEIILEYAESHPVILGCTELSLLTHKSKKLNTFDNIYDSMDSMVEEAFL